MNDAIETNTTPKFKLGAVVRLNSGGPEMTVYAIFDSTINCVWFTKNGTLERSDFGAESLSIDEFEEELPTDHVCDQI